MDRGMGVVCTLYVQCQFGCGTLKMVGPKMQDFAQESTCSKEIVLKQNNPAMNYALSKSAKIILTKSIFYVKKLTEFFQKKII